MIDWRQSIEETLINGTIAMCEENPELARLAFLTGSYSRGKHNSVRPNVNIYIISQACRSRELRLVAGQTWSTIRRQLRAQGIAFRVDCHPYTVAWRPDEDRGKPLLELTTKVLDANHSNTRFSLPPSIGLGWLAYNKQLWGDADLLKSLELPQDVPTAPVEWLTCLHEGLSHYRNILDHLPNAVPVDERPEIFAEEACFYGLEIVKDATSLAYSFEALAKGENVALLNAQEESDLFGSLGWEDLLISKTRLKEYEAQITSSDALDYETAVEIWTCALDVWDRVWARFQQRILELFKDDYPWLLRVNAFI